MILTVRVRLAAPKNVTIMAIERDQRRVGAGYRHRAQHALVLPTWHSLARSRVSALAERQGPAGADVHRLPGPGRLLVIRRLRAEHDDRAVVLALVEQRRVRQHALASARAAAGVRDDAHAPPTRSREARGRRRRTRRP